MLNIHVWDLNVKIYKEEDGSYYAKIVNLPGCFTMWETIEELKENLKEAATSYILSLQKDIEEYEFSNIDKQLANA